MTRPLTPETLVYGLVQATEPQISPDGSTVVYTRTTSDPDSKQSTSQLWLCNADGSNARQLTRSGARNSGARWSPDGRQIAFVSDRVSKSGLFVLPIGEHGEAREVVRHRQAISRGELSQPGAQVRKVGVVAKHCCRAIHVHSRAVELKNSMRGVRLVRPIA